MTLIDNMWINTFSRNINKGLFSHLGYKRDDNIVSFIGTTRTKSEYEALCVLEPFRRAYSIISSTNGIVLDCYDQYKNGLYIASYSNSPVGCWNTITGTNAVPNCRLVISQDSKKKKNFILRAGIKKDGKQSSKRFFIPPHTELLWDYGDSYISYDD